MNALAERFSHTLVALDGDYAGASRIDRGVRLRLLEAPAGKGKPLYFRALMGMIRRVAPDVLVTYNWGAFDALAAGCAARRCPVIHTEDGFGSDEARGLKTRRVWARRLLLNATHAVVVPSHTLRRLALESYRVRGPRVAFIPNGVDLNRFQPGRNRDIRRSWGVTDGEVLFGFAGRLSPEKNLPLLIRAFANAAGPVSKLVIIGDGPSRRELESLSAGLRAASRVVFTGAINDMSECYRALDVFVMSSVTEQMPMVLLEAMASGLPIICTDVGDSTAMLGEAGSAIVPSGDLESYTAAIARLAASERDRAENGAANRRRCEREYGLTRMVQTYRQLYDSALQRRNPPQ